MSNRTGLDVVLIGIDLSADRVSIRQTLSVEELISRALSDGRHGLHPEVIEYSSRFLVG